jgi:RNA polymerase sigma-70 factor (ECF subfamily)
MAIHSSAADEERVLVDRARSGDQIAVEELLAPLRKPLFSYIYRMVSGRQDAEDLLQDVLVRMLESLANFREEARFKTWLFGIATHACIDHLRRRKRWRVEAQLIGEHAVDEDPQGVAQLRSTLASPDFVFEIREHIALCFSCVSRSLEPEQQGALMLREVFGFTAEEAARMLGVSEPVFRHSLSAARSTMISSYEGLCQLINKTGRCYQCSGLREVTPESNRGPDLVQIEVGQGKEATPESLFDARLEIVRQARYPFGTTAPLDDLFLGLLSGQEESRVD